MKDNKVIGIHKSNTDIITDKLYAYIKIDKKEYDKELNKMGLSK